MFVNPSMSRLPMMAQLPAVISEAGLPPGASNDDIRVTDPARFARPSFIPQAEPTSAPSGMFASERKGHKGLFPGKDIKTILPMIANMVLAYSAGRGSPAAQIGLRANMEMLAERQKRQADAEQTQAYAQHLIASGVDPAQAALLAANPEKVAEQLATRFQTRNVDEGSSVYTPGLDGSASIFTAPKYFQHDADVVAAPPQASMLGAGSASVPLAPVPSLRTRGEQFADSIAQRGTPAWNEAVENYALRGYGPNAQEMLGQRLSTQRDIAYHRDATSTANNIRSTSTSAANNRRSTGVSRENSIRSNQTRRDTAHRGRSAGAVRVNTIEEARRLPPGTIFQTPDGRVKVR